jgi:CRISPR/Cas system-associated exonuclease Cas4 (RecB family)
MPDKYSATWISHSSISDYLACPRAYYLRNVYKDPKTNHKIQIVSPALSLGVSVHEVLEALSTLPTAKRFSRSLIPAYERAWSAVTGEAGGFTSASLEKEYFNRGKIMLQRVMEHPGPLANLAVKIKGDLPNYYLSEKDNIILCGKLDWLEYNEVNKTVQIIDFKTGKNREQVSSLQLPIYLLLAENCQKYQVARASYWYLWFDDELTPKTLPDSHSARKQLLEIGRRIGLARKLKSFKCPHGGCPACEPFERILRGEGKKVGENKQMRRDSYLMEARVGDDLEEIL